MGLYKTLWFVVSGKDFKHVAGRGCKIQSLQFKALGLQVLVLTMAYRPRLRQRYRRC